MLRKNHISAVLLLASLLLFLAVPVMAEGAEEETSQSFVYATVWSLLPPLIAIGLALITKEV